MAYGAIAAALIQYYLARRQERRDEPIRQAQLQSISQTLKAQRDADVYRQAALDPDSQFFRALSGISREREMNDLIRGLREYETREQRLRARGVQTTANRERRDETRAGLFTRGHQQAGIRGRQAASQALMSAAQGATGGMQGTAGPTQALMRFSDRRLGGEQALAGAGGQAFDAWLKHRSREQPVAQREYPDTGYYGLGWSWDSDYGDYPGMGR